MIKWRDFKTERPKDEQAILTKMKHGIISGWWNNDAGVCMGYYWSDLEWNAYYWVPIEEVE